MTDVPQPAPEPYSPDDQVRIYLDPTDPDAYTHGTVCEITAVLVDDLDIETGRPLDAYSYRLRDLETDAELWLAVRHRDLVSVEDTPASTEIPLAVTDGTRGPTGRSLSRLEPDDHPSDIRNLYCSNKI
jgi:hypothetical protein